MSPAVDVPLVDVRQRASRRRPSAPTTLLAQEYHLQALIAAEHATAPSSADTRWPRICTLYAALEDLTGSPVVRLARAVAVAEAYGPSAGLALLDGLDDALPRHHRLPAVRAELLVRAGDLCVGGRRVRARPRPGHQRRGAHPPRHPPLHPPLTATARGPRPAYARPALRPGAACRPATSGFDVDRSLRSDSSASKCTMRCGASSRPQPRHPERPVTADPLRVAAGAPGPSPRRHGPSTRSHRRHRDRRRPSGGPSRARLLVDDRGPTGPRTKVDPRVAAAIYIGCADGRGEGRRPSCWRAGDGARSASSARTAPRTGALCFSHQSAAILQGSRV